MFEIYYGFKGLVALFVVILPCLLMMRRKEYRT